MEWFENLRLPDYHLERKDGQYELTFEGLWPEVMLWEIPALSVLMELRGRAALNRMGKFELQVLYARAMTKLGKKLNVCAILKVCGSLISHTAATFFMAGLVRSGDGRRFGGKFVGTSNCSIARYREIEATDQRP